MNTSKCSILLGFCLLFCGVVAGCGNKTTGADMATARDLTATTSPDMTVLQCCGKPGDTGNSLGIGKYCTQTAECTTATAPICSTILGDQRFRFCTTSCKSPDMGGAANQCGENAQCQCRSVGCGCVPSSCLPATPGCEQN